MRSAIIVVGTTAAIAVGAAVWIATTNFDHRQADYALLTPDETAQWAGAQEAVRGLSLTQANGPAIKVNAPAGFSLVSPVSFDIEVQPRDGVAPDMNSLKIEYYLNPLWINVTRRIMAQAKMTGTHMKATGAELPVGKHLMRLTIKDARGRVTSADLDFVVKN